jgi:outer membrane murein-binding lipoprotein Lpp
MRRKTKKEISCGPWNLKGAMQSDRMLIVGLVVVIFVSVAVCGKVLFSWKKQWAGHGKWSQESEIQSLQAQINALKKQVSQNKTATTAPANTTASQKETASETPSGAFQKAVNDKDFTKVESLMAARVYYVIDQSGCCGDITKKEAAANLKNYISAVKSFNFDQNQQVVRQMKVNLADTFAKYTIGIADNKMVLSYHLNSQGKVDDLMLSASHLMYDLE